MKGSTTPTNCITQNFPVTRPFTVKLPKCNPIEKEYQDYEKLINIRMTKEPTLTKLKLCEVPPTGSENCHYLENVWEDFRSFTKNCYILSH